ncbi:MAG: hypothetical protein EXR72_25145 [Myxococcales bacterium]|nr:hypothetical protein [Myxococcales bacterium]
MTFEFNCPWCGSEAAVQGSVAASWRFKLPCELCEREMVVTWDGGLAVVRAPAHQQLERSDEKTAPFALIDAA